jgi:prophage tail gpP-like protein
MPRFPPPTPNPDEVATILVNGRQFDDWESVWVQHRYAEAWPLFRFTAAERDPLPELWTTLQFKPGDECAIYLGGILAIVGVITVRQVAYDANSHGVQLQGKGVTWYAAEGSIIDKDGNFDNQNFEQAANRVIAPFGVGVKTIGTLNPTPFARLQVEPGEKLWDFLERIARPRGIVMGSDHLGNFLLIGEHAAGVDDQLIEGQNILRCQCIISIENIRSEYLVRGQTAASDEQHGAQASEQEGKVPGSARRYSPYLTTAEQPVWSMAEVRDRARNESIWHEGDELHAVITVQGWLRSNGDLWRVGQNVYVYSPMAMLDMVMTIQTATFTQDSGSGTLTTLECVPPFLLRGSSDYNVAKAGVPQDPASYERAPPAAAATSVPAPPAVKIAPGAGS